MVYSSLALHYVLAKLQLKLTLVINAGLSLYVNLEQYNYVPFMTEASGLRVLVHDRYSMPFPRDVGYDIAPNTLTRMRIHRVSSCQRFHANSIFYQLSSGHFNLKVISSSYKD